MMRSALDAVVLGALLWTHVCFARPDARRRRAEAHRACAAGQLDLPARDVRVAELGRRCVPRRQPKLTQCAWRERTGIYELEVVDRVAPEEMFRAVVRDVGLDASFGRCRQPTPEQLAALVADPRVLTIQEDCARMTADRMTAE